MPNAELTASWTPVYDVYAHKTHGDLLETKAKGVLIEYTIILFNGPCEHMRGTIWDVEQTPFKHALQTFQRHKNDANKQNVEMKLNMVCKVKTNQP